MYLAFYYRANSLPVQQQQSFVQNETPIQSTWFEMMSINSMGMVVSMLIIWATMCNGNNIYDEIDQGVSEGKDQIISRSLYYSYIEYGRSNRYDQKLCRIG